MGTPLPGRTATNQNEQTPQYCAPDETLSVLDRAASKGTRSSFIPKAVLHYVATQGRKALRKQLEAGYRANSDHSLALAAEWSTNARPMGRTPFKAGTGSQRCAKRMCKLPGPK